MAVDLERARGFASTTRTLDDGSGGVWLAKFTLTGTADLVESLADEVERLRAELDLLGAGCATVIRCGETIRIIGPDGRGVFATINARMMESPPVDPPARMLKAVRRAMMTAREHSPHAIRARGVDGTLREVVQIPLGVWHEIEAAFRAVEEGA